MSSSGLLSLPRDILITLPTHLHNIEDLTNLSSTCHELRLCLESVNPNTILRLAAAQSSTFFRPSPYFLIAATARQLGNWARKDASNEAILASTVENGIEALLDLALEHCGLTMDRIRHFHSLRFTVFNPVMDIMCDCIGFQWQRNPDDENGNGDSVSIPEDYWERESNAGTICAEVDDVFFRFATYIELFGPDVRRLLVNATQTCLEEPTLSIDTRLEFVKYCFPGWSTVPFTDPSAHSRMIIKPTGPYAAGRHSNGNGDWALLYTLQNRTWRKHWNDFAVAAGADAAIVDDLSKYPDLSWRVQLWLNTVLCQWGIEGLEMISPAVPLETRLAKWGDNVKHWSRLIAWLETPPKRAVVGRSLTTPEAPCIVDELKVFDGDMARHWRE